jgi:tetratricopeptide (TPR) repeat protein
MDDNALAEMVGHAARFASWVVLAALVLTIVDMVPATLLMRRARRHFAAGRRAPAVRLQRFVLLFPLTRLLHDAPIRGRLAVMLASDGHVEEAANEALRALPRLTSAARTPTIVALASVAQRGRDPAAADALVEGFLATADPARRRELHRLRASFALEFGCWAEMASALASDAGDADWRRHGRVLAALAQGDIALAGRLIDEPGAEGLGRVTRAWVLCLAGRGDELDAQLADAIAGLDGDGGESPVLLAVAAMRAAQRGLPTAMHDYVSRALHALAQPHRAGAVRHDHVTTRMGLARAALDAGEPAEALRLIDPAASFAHSPRTRHRVAFLRARALEALGRRSEATAAFDEAQRQGDFEWTAEAGLRLAELRSAARK